MTKIEEPKVDPATIESPMPTSSPIYQTPRPAPQSDASSQDARRKPTPIERQTACQHAIQVVLREYGCRIMAHMQPEPVGDGPLSRMLVSAGWGIYPIE